MNRLDKIEARDKDTDEWLIRNDGWSHPEGRTATMHSDRKLLIRAVRQLGVAYQALALENALGKSDVDYKIDPDVLELINETE